MIQPAATRPRASVAPAQPGRFVPGRMWAWPSQRGATIYLVRFFRNGRKLLELHPSEPHFVLPVGFRFEPGQYRWEVLARIGPRRRQTRVVVESEFELPSAVVMH